MVKRIPALDILRGFALIGILGANIPGLAHVVLPAAGSTDDTLFRIDQYGFEQRFFPIFSFLFGVGFYIFMRNAEHKALSARTLFIRRVLVLLGFGIVHQLLQPGEALLIYGIFGLLLVPFAHASVPILFTASGGTLLAGLVLSEYFVVLAMFLLGAAIAKAGYFHTPQRYVSVTQRVLLASVVLCPVVLFAQASVTNDRSPWVNYASNVQTLAGLVVAAGMVSAVCLALQRPKARRWLGVLAPFGRMALSNYIGQTLIVLAFVWATGLRDVMTYRQAAALWLLVCAGQIVVSHLWLRRFRYGPLEWVWRWATYGHRPPVLNTPTSATVLT